MTAEQRLFLVDLQRDAILATTSSPLAPLTQSDQEDEVTDWLRGHGMSDGRKIAPTLVRSGLDTQRLEKVVEHIPTEPLTQWGDKGEFGYAHGGRMTVY